MEDHYGMPDLSHYMNGRPNFQPMPPLEVPDLLSGHHHTLTPPQNYSDMFLLGRQATTEINPGGIHQEFRLGSATGPSNFGGLEMDGSWLMGDGGSGRWPRQETLALLEIRTKLDSKFKESVQKGPLWEEVARIMSEEHGYQRTGKKCREKFENLYKYYKKTKDGKAGRHDGKKYRFFRQLEAIYGDSRNASSFSGIPLIGSSFRYENDTTQDALGPSKLSDQSISFSNSSCFYSLSSENSDLNVTMDNETSDKERKSRKSKRNWRAKIKDFIDSQMMNLMEKQEASLEKMTKMIEEKEQERMIREEEWRKQEEDRLSREQKLWASEKTWIQARDAYLLETMKNLTSGKGVHNKPPMDLISKNFEFASSSSDDMWQECEITSLIQVRTFMEERFQEMDGYEEVLWEEVAAKMACFGYDRNASMCKDKWESISNYFIMKGSMKKKKEDSRAFPHAMNAPINSDMGGGNYTCNANAQGFKNWKA